MHRHNQAILIVLVNKFHASKSKWTWDMIKKPKLDKQMDWQEAFRFTGQN